MTDAAGTVINPEFKDRKVWLIVFGVLEIVFGAVCALMVPFMFLSLAVTAIAPPAAKVPPVQINMIIPAILIYGLLAVWFIWMGIGSVMTRRWARALLLVTSWVWLISGIGGLAMMLLFMPDFLNTLPQSTQVPPAAILVMKVVMYGFMTVIYVLMPGVLVLFYGGRQVKATCERRDPVIRWTDRCPLPVLALSLISGSGAMSLLLLGFYGWAIPFFGVIVTGVTGATVALTGCVVLGYVAWGTYRLQMPAWWCAILLILFWGSSTGLTFSQVSLLDYYEKMKFPADQLAIFKQMHFLQGSAIMWISLVWAVMVLAYVIYLRKFFLAPPPAPPIPPPS